jgi:RNA polymerase sigma-70 factor (sigma-E family)
MRSTEDPAFEAFVLAHGPELLAFARRLTMDHHRAEDIVQDVLARVGLAWARIERVGDVRAYVYKAILNDFLSWRRRFSSSERPAADLDRYRTGSVPGADEAVVQRDELQEALAVLPPVQRAVLVLRYHQDRPDAEIAALLGCRESTVRSHARRALTTLRAARTSEGAQR